MNLIEKFREKSIPYKKEIEKIHAFHNQIESFTQEQLIQLANDCKTQNLNEKELKVKSYAIIYEVIRRTLKVTPYDVQLSGAVALREGNIAQMRTGEGKTITALIPAFWGYMANMKTYIFTVNEYLAERDYEQAKQVFNYLNIDVGLVLKDMNLPQKKKQYSSPIVFVTNTEFAFDYLRDNLAQDISDVMQSSHDFAILDEADLVLIDEAKNPVIISSESFENINIASHADKFVGTLKEDVDYVVDDEAFVPYLTDEGYNNGKRYFGHELTEHQSLHHSIRQSLFAYARFEKDVDYLVQDNEVHLIDKYTGRILKGRRFQNGLHQAIEAKEKVKINSENVAMAMTTYQSLFLNFKILSGMTGTGIESKGEFQEIYHMNTIKIPTNKPIKRIDHPDKMFETKEAKERYVLELVSERNQKGQPILIGTTSVKESEEIAQLLHKAEIHFELLNAKNDKQEAEIIERAGEKGAVIIATNMAGRGTDIRISKEVEELGGLLVLGTSRNESKRIDRQLQGRSGRQGQVGESMFVTSLEDEFLVMNATNRLENFAEKNKKFPVTKLVATKMVDEVQEVQDSKNASVRKMQLQMDEIIHYQREFVYEKRKNLLHNGFNRLELKEMLDEWVAQSIGKWLEESPDIQTWETSWVSSKVFESLQLEISLEEFEGVRKVEMLKVYLTDRLLSVFDQLMENVSPELVEQVSKQTALKMMDNLWMNYLEEMNLYKQGFSFTSFGEQDPVRKYSFDMDDLFTNLLNGSKVEFLTELSKKIYAESLNEKDQHLITLSFG